MADPFESADDEDSVAAARGGRTLRMLGLSLAVVFLGTVIVGILMAHFDHGGGSMSTTLLAIIAAILLLLGTAVWLLLKLTRAPTGEEPLHPKEKLNRNILIACGAIGGVTAIVMTLASERGPVEGGGVFSNDPLPTGVAIVLLIVLGLVVPVISYFWHQTVDEQEADAYKTGALYGFYVYGVGAPLWWIAWRGGLAPEPNGFAIYFATVFAVGIVWMWKKYR